MSDDVDDLVSFLAAHSKLTQDESRRLLAELNLFFDETAEAFVRRRHQELQDSGLRNSAIFQRIQQEMGGRRFKAEDLSERQIRRMIYG